MAKAKAKRPKRPQLRPDPIQLTLDRHGNGFVGGKAAWMYECPSGLDVIIEIQLPERVVTVSQRIPWRIVERCVDRYRAVNYTLHKARKL